MENEVFPTNFIKKKNEIYGSNKTFEKPFTGMKTYHGEELKPYMKEQMGEAMQTENIAKYHFDNTNHRNQYNQSVGFIQTFNRFWFLIWILAPSIT